MLCEICGRRQGVVKGMTINNVRRKICVCAECEARANTEAAKRGRSAQTECSLCGWTSDDFLETNLVGCEHCYTDLAPAIAEAIRRCQPTGFHVGKAPEETYASRGGEYEYLRGELDRAVREERYADAASLKRLLDRFKEGR